MPCPPARARRPSSSAAQTLARLGAAIVAGSAFPVPAQDGDTDTAGRYSLQLEEVLVTAQKREESYMAVPITVNAFTAQDMINTGAVGIRDIDNFMPGVEIGDTFGGGSSTQTGITVRGVSSPNISSGGDPSVATFYDGAYMPRAVTSIPFTDIARTEVLKGPQGTLFGRNATAGVINIVPNKPHQELEGFLKTRVGNYDLVRLEGMLNLPLSDRLAFRGNLFSHQRDGITRNDGIGRDVRDEEFQAARAVLLFSQSPYTEWQLSVDVENRDEMPRAAIGVGDYAYRGNNNPFSGRTAHDVIGGQEETREMYGASLKLEHDLNSDWSLFGILSYRDWETTNLEEEDGTPEPRRYLDTNNIEQSDIWYGELRLNYVYDRINLIAGTNYSDESVFQRTDIGLLADSYMQFVSIEALGDPDDKDTHLWDLFDGFPDSFWLDQSEANGVAVLPPLLQGSLFLRDHGQQRKLHQLGSIRRHDLPVDRPLAAGRGPALQLRREELQLADLPIGAGLALRPGPGGL